MKLKKICFSVVASACFLLNVFPANAQTKAVTYPCGSCGVGQVFVTTTRTYEHDESFPCRHHSYGTDLYSVYEVVTNEKCNSCGYNYTYTVNDHVLKSCRGYD